jgi:hypothetical protein
VSDQPAPLTTWAAHRAPWLYAAYGWSAVVILPFPEPRGMAYALWCLAAVAAGIFVGNAQARHDYAYCQRCVDETLNSDVIPSEEAERQRTALWLHHKWHTSWSLAFMVLGWVVLALFLGRVGAALSAAAVWTTVGVAVAYQARHSRLMPWCPFCRHRGGDDDHEPVPEPSPPGVTT